LLGAGDVLETRGAVDVDVVNRRGANDIVRPIGVFEVNTNRSGVFSIVQAGDGIFIAATVVRIGDGFVVGLLIVSDTLALSDVGAFVTGV